MSIHVPNEHSTFSNSLVHIIVPAVLSCLYFASALYNVNAFNVNTWDYGIFSTLMWNFSHGNGWYVPFYEGSVYANFLADHFTLMPILLAPVFYVFPSYITLSVVQSSAIAATFFLAPIYVKEVYKSLSRSDYIYSALFLTVFLACFRGLTAAASYQAHMTTLTLPFILSALIALHRKSFVWAILFCILVSFGQERSVVAVSGIGMYSFFILHQYRFGIGVFAAASLYFLVIYKFITPFYAKGSYKYISSLNPLWGIGLKTKFLFKLFSGWVFLPVVGKKALLATFCGFPLLGVALVSDRGAMISFAHHYQDMPSIFFFAGATYGWACLTSTNVYTRIPKKIVVLVCLGMVIGTAHASRHSLPLMNIFKGSTAHSEKLNSILQKYSNIDKDVSVYSQSGIATRYAMRKNTFHLSREKAEEQFTDAIVFISPLVGAYPEADILILRQILDANTSIKPVLIDESLMIYATDSIVFGEEIYKKEES